MIVSVVFGLIACNELSNGGSDTLSDPNLQKVKTAFDGVERSMTKSASSDVTAASVQAYKALFLAPADATGATATADPLEIIHSIYTTGDRQSASSVEIDYDQPPMRQFQYLKAIFEEMGDGYELGTKYFYDITGMVDFDPETGFSKKGDANYRYNYVFTFSMSIELRENDLIFAEVAFHIALTRGTDVKETHWYVSFDLDYDFDESNPTYTLTMYTDNKEGDLAFLDRDQGYEYDYVEMSKGNIVEWRKFEYDAKQEIVFDAVHPDFASYVNDGLIYKVGTCKWLKDGVYNKVTQMNDDKQRILGAALADGIGLNSTHINAAAFVGKSGKVNSAIDTYYKKICQLYGGDIIYDLVCKKEDDGGNDNGFSAHAWNSSVGSAVAALSSLVPGFESATASFTADVGDSGVLITVNGATASDYDTFKGSLERVGFAISEVQDGTEIYVKVTPENNIIVAINTERNVIWVTVYANTNGGNGGDVTTKTIEMLYACDYNDGYTAYNGGYRYTFVKELTDIIEDLTFGRITANEITAPGSLSVNDSWFYDITLVASSYQSAEECASEILEKYSGNYLGEDSIWTNIEGNRLNYAFINGKDVLVILASDVVNGDPHLYVYVLQFEEGNLPRILEKDDTATGGDNNGTEGGNNGNEGGEVIGGDNNGTEGGDDGGNGENGNGNEGNVQKQTDVTVYYFEADGNVRTATFTREIGTTLDVNEFAKGEECKVYLDKGLREEAPARIKVVEGLTLYVRSAQQQAQKTAYIVVYDRANGALVESGKYETLVGLTDYYGYSFGHIVYRDKDCTEQVPLEQRIELSEDGLVLYKNTTLDYVTVNVEFYLNGVLLSTTPKVYERDRIYWNINNLVIDSSYTYYAEKPVFFLGDDRTKEIAYGDRIAFTEDVTTIKGYGSNREYGIYTVVAGERELGQVVTNTPGYITSYGDLFSHNCEVEKASNVIRLVEPRRYKTYNVEYRWNGRTLWSEVSYFEEDYVLLTDSAEIAESPAYFTDAACTTPIQYSKGEGGVYTYTITTSTTLYVPYRK